METIEHIVRQPAQRTRQTPLFFQHGAWHGAWCWGPYLDFFTSRGYEVHAINLPGREKSSLNKGHINKYSLQNYVDFMAAEVARVSPLPVVIGHSLGGALVQKYLQKHHPPAAVLISSVPVHGFILGLLRLLWRFPVRSLRAVLLLDGYAWVETPEMARTIFLSPDTAVDVVAFQARLVRESMRIGYRVALWPTLRVKNNTTPVLVMAAEKDAFFSPAEERATSKALNARHVQLPGAHNVMMEPPALQAAELIDQWLTQELKLP